MLEGREREREREREERERERERERENVTVCGLGGQVPGSIPLVGFSKGFFSGRTFTQGLKITGEKHAGNLGVGQSIAQKSCALVPCA